ncbi:RNA-guided endonuclease InsQ/TnpB family protein [Coleofasciculus sp. F4-SAH-05]|uniref:RNA-guided endonuclease InsQ/TnpB family protein n=1 Tax=Coleofasciculus sp. F4-SAH-05 TaxID=3069525 RepID=UPI0032FF57F4
MLVYEFKVKASKAQLRSIDEAIRIGQFIRNKCLRYWLDAPREKKVNRYTLNKYTKVLSEAPASPFVAALNSMARQAAAERAWASISRFYDNCKKIETRHGASVQGKKGFPKFKKNCRSVEYKTSGWKLSDNRKYLTITDKTGIGRLKLVGTRDLHFYQQSQIKRIRLIRRTDAYYAQFCIDVERRESVDTSTSLGVKQINRQIGLDVGLNYFYTDSDGNQVNNPRFLRKSEKKLKRLQRRLSKCTKGSQNRKKVQHRLGRQHLKVSRQRKDFAVKLARCVMKSNDFVAIEDLNVRGLVKNHKLAKSISDAGWTIFREWLEYFANLFGRELVAINPSFTSQDCSCCGARVKKSLSTRTHVCSCGAVLDRDWNAAINILIKALDSVGHTRISQEYWVNASGQLA